jgi:hypothetical protein
MSKLLMMLLTFFIGLVSVYCLTNSLGSLFFEFPKALSLYLKKFVDVIFAVSYIIAGIFFLLLTIGVIWLAQNLIISYPGMFITGCLLGIGATIKYTFSREGRELLLQNFTRRSFKAATPEYLTFLKSVNIKVIANVLMKCYEEPLDSENNIKLRNLLQLDHTLKRDCEKEVIEELTKIGANEDVIWFWKDWLV